MRFVLVNYETRGDVEPFVAVGQELLRRGHDVRMAVPNDSLGFVESAGLAAVAYGLDSQAVEVLRRDTSFDPQVESRTATSLAELVSQLERPRAVWLMIPAGKITLMVDSPDHLDLIEKVAATVPGPAPVQVCMDIDTSYYGLGGLLRAGARRSPVRTPADAVALAQDIAARPAIRLTGLMAYEAQIAGVGDRPAGSEPETERLGRAIAFGHVSSHAR